MELQRLCRRKKLLHDRMRRHPTPINKTRYEDSCATVHWRKRQLNWEQQRRRCPRIQQDPTSHVAKALQLSAQRRARQLALETTVGNLLRPRQFAEYLNTSMGGVNHIRAKPFTVDVDRHTRNVILAMKYMANNKEIGTDGIHVEMIKPNAVKAASLITGIWQVVGKYGVVPQ